MSGGNSEAIITSGVPRTRMLGIHDKSARKVSRDPLPTPDHLPKVYLYAEKGPSEPMLVNAADRDMLYGARTFDERDIYATHQTALVNTCFTKGNVCMIQRVIPQDAPPPATVGISFDVLKTSIKQYQRNYDGSFALDLNQQKIETGTFIDGYSINIISEMIPLDIDGNSTFGIRPIKQGTRVDTVTGAESTVYPIHDFMVSSQGASGNNKGIRLFVPTTKSEIQVNDKLVTNQKIFPYALACVERANLLSTSSVIDTMAGDRFINVSLEKNALDKTVDQELYVADRFVQSWNDNEDATVAPIIGAFDKFHVYQEHVDYLLDLFVKSELPYMTSDSDFAITTDSTGVVVTEDPIYLFNPWSGVSSNNTPYYSYEIAQGSIRFNPNTILWASGGGDGTMSLTNFSRDVGNMVEEYLNPNSLLQQSAYHCETFIYDTGFLLEDKYKLLSFIARRKDTAVVLSTYTVGGRDLTVGEESSVGRALSVRALLYPESAYYGTSTCRSMVLAGYGTMKSSRYRSQLPLAVEISSKLAAYHGSSNGTWKTGFSYDDEKNNRVELFKNIKNAFRPANVRENDWNNGVVFVEHFDRATLYWPALQTVYDNDTSVLNSIKFVTACIALQRFGQEAQRQYSGNASLTNAQYAARIRDYIQTKAEGHFDSAYVVETEVGYTDKDLQRGYSYNTVIRIYGPTMKTVQTLTVESLRIEELSNATR